MTAAQQLASAVAIGAGLGAVAGLVMLAWLLWPWRRK